MLELKTLIPEWRILPSKVTNAPDAAKENDLEANVTGKIVSEAEGKLERK